MSDSRGTFNRSARRHPSPARFRRMAHRVVEACFYIASISAIVIAGIHVSTFLGLRPSRLGIPEWIYFVVLAPPWIVMIFSDRTVSSRKDFWREVTRHAPKWMRTLMIVSLAYSFITFTAYMMITKDRQAVEVDGKKGLVSEGKIIREISDEEFERYRLYKDRLNTGFCLSFYITAMTSLRSKLNDEGDPYFRPSRFKFLRSNPR